jgi:hypothetical protein
LDLPTYSVHVDRGVHTTLSTVLPFVISSKLPPHSYRLIVNNSTLISALELFAPHEVIPFFPR